MVVLGWWLDLMMLDVFSNLNDSMILWVYVVQVMQRMLSCHQSCRSKSWTLPKQTMDTTEQRSHHRPSPALWSGHISRVTWSEAPERDRFILFLLKFFSNLQHILLKVSESYNSKITLAISKGQNKKRPNFEKYSAVKISSKIRGNQSCSVSLSAREYKLCKTSGLGQHIESSSFILRLTAVWGNCSSCVRQIRAIELNRYTLLQCRVAEIPCCALLMIGKWNLIHSHKGEKNNN